MTVRRVVVVAVVVVVACYAFVLADEWVNGDVFRARRIFDGQG